MGRYGRNSLTPAAVANARILLVVIILRVFFLYPSPVIAKKRGDETGPETRGAAEGGGQGQQSSREQQLGSGAVGSAPVSLGFEQSHLRHSCSH